MAADNNYYCLLVVSIAADYFHKLVAHCYQCIVAVNVAVTLIVVMAVDIVAEAVGHTEIEEYIAAGVVEEYTGAEA